MFTPVPQKRRYLLSADQKLKHFKKLREKYIEKYGYHKKVVIDDVVTDFLNSHNFAIEHIDFVKLDKYMETRINGVISSHMMKFSYIGDAAKKREERIKKQQAAKKKRTFSRDCECNPRSQRGKRQPVSWRSSSEDRNKKVVEEPSNQELRPAGFVKKPHYERKQ